MVADGVGHRDCINLAVGDRGPRLCSRLDIRDQVTDLYDRTDCRRSDVGKREEPAGYGMAGGKPGLDEGMEICLFVLLAGSCGNGEGEEPRRIVVEMC